MGHTVVDFKINVYLKVRISTKHYIIYIVFMNSGIEPFKLLLVRGIVFMLSVAKIVAVQALIRKPF